ncbi:MAG: glycosyltransferase [Gemmatimonadales bacterium]|nr:glycosyltransferase [Gemmatimonadales bacterium]
MAAEDVDVSIVVFHSDVAALEETVRSLRTALASAREAGLLRRATLRLVDNGSPDPARLDRKAFEGLAPEADWLALEVLRGHGNVGYGRGHACAVEQGSAPHHLVLNPDVVLDSEAVTEALQYLHAHPHVGLVAPHVVGASGEREFLCKRYPSILTLALRGFAPGWLRRPFRGMLERYEMRDLPEDRAVTGVPIASGAFMFLRRAALDAVGGFSPDYFLYFEDFDLSLRLGRIADIAWVPSVRIRHTGGRAARKGWAQRRLFLASATTFFQRHGWKLV